MKLKPGSIQLETRDEITVIRLSRPPANAFCLEFAHEMADVLAADETTRAKALVLTGCGRFFSAGLDLRAVPTYSAAQQKQFLGLLNRLIGRLYSWPAPVVAAVNGHAIAAGFIFALAADYRVGSEDPGAQFGLTEARVGIPFPAVPMIILQAELAPSDVRFTTLYARNYGCRQAAARGVFDELRDPADVLERAVEVARDMASMPSDSYARIKRQVRGAAIARIEEVIEKGTEPMLDHWFSENAREASAAVLATPRPGSKPF